MSESKVRPILTAENVTMRFGGVTAVSDLSLKVDEGSIVGVIGPNGAGKTTVFNVLSGFYTPQEGDVRFAGRSIRGRKPFEICRMGMARTFQNIRLSPHMSVLENVMVGCHVRRRCPWWMAPLLVKEIFNIIRRINEDGMTVLLVEQNAFAALSVAHYAYILEVGRVVLEGTGQELLENPKVKEAYLGG